MESTMSWSKRACMYGPIWQPHVWGKTFVHEGLFSSGSGRDKTYLIFSIIRENFVPWLEPAAFSVFLNTHNRTNSRHSTTTSLEHGMGGRSPLKPSNFGDGWSVFFVKLYERRWPRATEVGTVTHLERRTFQWSNWPPTLTKALSQRAIIFGVSPLYADMLDAEGTKFGMMTIGYAKVLWDPPHPNPRWRAKPTQFWRPSIRTIPFELQPP